MKQMAALRAEWFVQLGDAIESAQRLAWQLGRHERTSMEARQLYRKLEAARLKLDSLQGLGLQPAHTIDPEWMQKLGWIGPMSDPAA